MVDMHVSSIGSSEIGMVLLHREVRVRTFNPAIA